MFKHIIYIINFCFILGLVSCAGKSKQGDFAAAPLEESKSIGGNGVEFTEELNINKLPNKLSKEQEEAFDLRSKQKFQDFLDYLKIVSNPKIDEGLAKHSEELLKELFISDTVTIFDNDSTFYIRTEQINEPIRLFDYLKRVSQKEELTSKSFNVFFIEPLRFDSVKNNYTGKLTAEILINHKHTIKNVEISLIETTKQFGDTELKSIEIKLGNIY